MLGQRSYRVKCMVDLSDFAIISKAEIWHMPGMCEVRVPARREEEVNEKTEGRKEGREDKVS